MSNITITNNDLGSPILEEADFRDEILTVASAATIKAGTILARDSSTGKMVPFVKGGSTNGNGVPKSIITYEVTTSSAMDVAIRCAVEGDYRLERLVIDADGDASNIDGVVVDELRAYGLTPIDVTELNIYDNQ